MQIRMANESDYDQIWDIFSEVIRTGDTYVFDPKTPRPDLEKHWFAGYMTTFAAEEKGTIAGATSVDKAQGGVGLGPRRIRRDTAWHGLLCQSWILRALHLVYPGLPYAIGDVIEGQGPLLPKVEFGRLQERVILARQTNAVACLT